MSILYFLSKGEVILKKIVNFIKAIYYRLLSPNKVAEIVGVNFGKNCIFRTKNFGSEPYLIKTGNNVATSSNVTFITHDGSLHVLRNLYDEYQKADLFKPIVIGDNVFIGLGATILPGTLIGNNVIVGANSIVKGELKSNSVYAGVPAQYICSIEEYKNKNTEFLDYTKHLKGEDKKPILLEKFQDVLKINRTN